MTLTRGIWIAYWLTIFAATHTPKLPKTRASIEPLDKLLHGTMFFGLTVLGGYSLGLTCRKSPTPILLWMVLYGAYGIADEWTQRFVGRTPDAADWLADGCGVLLGSMLLLVRWNSSRANRG